MKRARMFDKLGVPNRTQSVHMVKTDTNTMEIIYQNLSKKDYFDMAHSIKDHEHITIQCAEHEELNPRAFRDAWLTFMRLARQYEEMSRIIK